MKHTTALSLLVGLAHASNHLVHEAGAAPSAVAPAESGPAHVGGGQVHVVTVGGPERPFSYFPEQLHAAVGDIITFQFLQKNHTVTESTFSEPCKKKEGGIDSEFMPNAEGRKDLLWNVTVDTTEPRWFYCKQRTGTHCGQGMVFSLNPTVEKKHEDFKILAVKLNGTELDLAAIQKADAPAGGAPEPVTVQAEANPTAVATHVTVMSHPAPAASAPAAPAPAAPAPAGQETAIVVEGTRGEDDDPNCSCKCLCGVNSFPPEAAMHSFGGFAGLMQV